MMITRLVLVVCVASAAGSARATEGPIRPGEKLTLDRAVELALQYHPARLAARSRTAAAGERVGEARAALLPQVFGVAEYLRATDNGIGDTTYLPAPGIPRAPTTGRHVNDLAETFNNYLAGISAYQYLFDFGRTRGLIHERNAEADAERARLKLVDLDLVYGASKAYFDLVAAKEIVRVFETAVSQREQHLQEAEVKARAGLSPEIDTYTAQSELARTRLNLVNARNGAATAKVALDNAMGLGMNAPDYEQVDALTYSEITEPVDVYLRSALAQRPDLKVLEDEARAAGAQITQARGEGLPSVGAIAGYDARGQDATPGNNFHAGIVIAWPIFTGFLTDHEAMEAKLRQDALAHSIEDLRQQIVLQVRSAFLDWQASVERIHQADRTLEASRVELDLAEKRYEKGLGSIIELTDAQRRFTEDRAAQVQALAGFSVARATLDRDTGTSPLAGGNSARSG
jgi:outer membrane protein TolC